MRSAHDVALDRLVAVGEHADRRTVLAPVEGEARAAAEVAGAGLGHVADPHVGVGPDVGARERHAFSRGVIGRATDQHLAHAEDLGRRLGGGVEDRVARDASAAEAVLELRRRAGAGPHGVRNHDAGVRRALAIGDHTVERQLDVLGDVERREIGGRVGGAGVGAGEVARVEDLAGHADFVSEQELPAGQLGGDNLGVEEARDVRGDRVIDGLFVTVLQRGVRLLGEGARATREGGVGVTHLHVRLEQLAFLQLEGGILTSEDGHVEDRHHARADQTSLPVFGLLEDAGDVATENGGRIGVHCRKILSLRVTGSSG